MLCILVRSSPFSFRIFFWVILTSVILVVFVVLPSEVDAFFEFGNFESVILVIRVLCKSLLGFLKAFLKSVGFRTVCTYKLLLSCCALDADYGAIRRFNVYEIMLGHFFGECVCFFVGVEAVGGFYEVAVSVIAFYCVHFGSLLSYRYFITLGFRITA